MFRPTTSLLLLLLLPSFLRAQDVPATKDPAFAALEGRISQFFEDVSSGQTQNAFQSLLTGSPLAKQTEALKTLIEKTKELQTKYGQYRAFEQIGARRVGSDLVLMKYLYKCQQAPVVWYFAFYRSAGVGDPPSEKDNWRVITVRFDTDLESLDRN